MFIKFMTHSQGKFILYEVDSYIIAEVRDELNEDKKQQDDRIHADIIISPSSIPTPCTYTYLTFRIKADSALVTAVTKFDVYIMNDAGNTIQKLTPYIEKY